MNESTQQLISEPWDGHADLVIEALGVMEKGLSIRFDPQRLCITVSMSSQSAVVKALTLRLEPVQLVLRDVLLGNGTAVRLRAEALAFDRIHWIGGWPVDHCHSGGAEKPCLELSPSVMELAFITDKPISETHPFHVFYGEACPGFRVPYALQHPSLPAEVFLSGDCPMPGVLWAASAEDFFGQEPRIHVAWKLIHGRDLPWVLKVKMCDVCFYGNKPHARHSYMPLANAGDVALPESVMHRFLGLGLESTDFDNMQFALRYYLAGKDSDVPLELRYLMLMNCVDAMDGEKIGQLKERTTAAMLGVSTDAARLFNGMRNKLTHRALGYQEAFDRLIKEDVGQEGLCFEPELQSFLQGGRELDFLQVWLRLCERLDAFWCAYLNVQPNITAYRYARVALMPAVDLSLLEHATRAVVSKAGKGESTQIQELVEANERQIEKCQEQQKKRLQQIQDLVGENRKLKEQLARYDLRDDMAEGEPCEERNGSSRQRL